jgi:propionyl-CoA synthetase
LLRTNTNTQEGDYRKILRKTIRQLAVQDDVPVPPTIDDPAILDEIRETMQTCGIGQYAKSS